MTNINPAPADLLPALYNIISSGGVKCSAPSANSVIYRTGFRASV